MNSGHSNNPYRSFSHTSHGTHKSKVNQQSRPQSRNQRVAAASLPHSLSNSLCSGSLKNPDDILAGRKSKKKKKGPAVVNTNEYDFVNYIKRAKRSQIMIQETGGATTARQGTAAASSRSHCGSAVDITVPQQQYAYVHHSIRDGSEVNTNQ